MFSSQLSGIEADTNSPVFCTLFTCRLSLANFVGKNGDVGNLMENLQIYQNQPKMTRYVCMQNTIRIMDPANFSL